MQSSHNLKSTDAYLAVTEQLKKAVHKTMKDEVTITIVPIMMSFGGLVDEAIVLSFKSLLLRIHSK